MGNCKRYTTCSIICPHHGGPHILAGGSCPCGTPLAPRTGVHNDQDWGTLQSVLGYAQPGLGYPQEGHEIRDLDPPRRDMRPESEVPQERTRDQSLGKGLGT